MKKTLIVAVVIMMVCTLVLTGCGGESQDSTNTSEETQATTVETAESSGEGGDDELVIGLVMQDIIGQMGSDLRAAAYYEADQLGVDEVMFIDGQSNLENQVNGIDDLLASGKLDAIIIWPCDDQGISQSVKACNEANVPVITVDVVSQEGEVVNHVASDNMEIGRMDGEFAVEILKEKYGTEKGVIIVTGYPQLNSMRERVAGFLEVIEQYPDIEYFEHDFAENTFEAGQALTDDLMQVYPEGSFDILYGSNCAPGLGAITSAATLGRTDFAVVTVDNIEQFIVECQKGAGNTILRGFVAQDPIDMGITAMDCAVRAANEEDPGEYLTATNIQMVTPDNVEDFLADYQEMSDKIAPFR